MKRYDFSKVLLLNFFLLLALITAKGQDKQEQKIEAATQVLKDFGDMKENIPAELLKITQGIIVVPRLLNGGFVLAAKEERVLQW